MFNDYKVTFVCVLDSVNIRDLFRIEGMTKVFNFLSIDAVFEQTNIHDVFKIV